MPSGGDGYYYFSVYFLVTNDEFGRFNIEMNGDILCTAYTEEEETPFDPGQAVCSAAIFAGEGMNNLYLYILYFEHKINYNSIFIWLHTVFLFIGDTVQVVYDNGADTTPLFEGTSLYYHGFSGFRI